MRASIRQLMHEQATSFTSAENKVFGTLLANYPSAALTTLSSLAAQAGVSDPTVHRMIVKLGFDGFPEFQKTLLAEVDERMNSPLSMLDAAAYQHPGDDVQKSILGHLAISLGRTADNSSSGEFDKSVDLLADTAGSVLCCGGRSSAFLASRLAAHLSHLRPHARQIEPSLERSNEALMDIEPDDVLVAYDYRRYQESVIQFAREAKRRGARVILLTDEWRSPIAHFADSVLTTVVQTFSPFDTKVPALAQGEALIAALVQRFPERAKARLKAIEALRNGEGSTVIGGTDKQAEREKTPEPLGQGAAP